MNKKESIIFDAVKSVLTPDLVKEGMRDSGKGPMFGHCYAASEAMYNLLGGKTAGYKACRGIDKNGVSHWWILSPTGEILDPTSEQYTDFGETPPYQGGKGAAFRGISNRGREIMRRAMQKLENS